MAYHKWSNLKLTLNDYKAILSCHMAQSSCFNWMVEGGKKNYFAKCFKNPNDVMNHILKLSHVNKLLMHIVVTSVVVSVVT
jgi:hypothetical protein